MKTKNIIGLALLTATLALFTITSRAKDWVITTNALPTGLTNCVNAPGNAGIATSNSTSVSEAFPIPQGVPWSIAIPNILTSNGGGPLTQNSNTVYYIDLSQDKVNFTSYQPISLTVAETGTNSPAAMVGTNFVAGAWGGWQWGKVTRVTTGQTNAVYTPYLYVGAYQ